VNAFSRAGWLPAERLNLKTEAETFFASPITIPIRKGRFLRCCSPARNRRWCLKKRRIRLQSGITFVSGASRERLMACRSGSAQARTISGSIFRERNARFHIRSMVISIRSARRSKMI